MLHYFIFFRWLLRMVVEVALTRKIQVQIRPSLVCGTNMGKVELQDDCHSMSTLQSAVEEKAQIPRKYEAYNF